MEVKNIVVSEKHRPYWQLIIAAFCFTLTLALIIFSFWRVEWTHEGYKYLIINLKAIIPIAVLGIGFSSRQTVYIDFLNLKIRPTIEVGPIKIGKWQTLNNLEYISIFPRLKSDGLEAFEVNLWYERNKHVELYERDNFEEAYKMAFKIADFLKIDLLDSTETHNAKWVNMKASKTQGKIIYFEQENI